MKIDWQMYEDGLLEPEDMRKAEEALANDEGARKELDGLRAFRKMVRASALREPVPHGKLRSILRDVIGRQPAWRLYGAVAVAAASMAWLASVVLGPVPGGPSDEVYQSFKSPQAAQTWASNRSGLNLPAIQLTSIGQVQGVHSAPEWACFDFMAGDQLVHIFMQAGDPPTGCETVLMEGREYYVPLGSQKVCFTQNGVMFTVNCNDEDLRWRVALRAAQEAELVL